MSLLENSSSPKKISLNNENSVNNDSSEIKIVEETIVKPTTKEKNYQHKDKDKSQSKKQNPKKLSNDIEIVQEKKIVKVKTLIDDDYINNYDPMIQDKSIPKLNFFIDNESVSESDKDLSSASLSSESMENDKENNK